MSHDLQAALWRGCVLALRRDRALAEPIWEFAPPGQVVLPNAQAWQLVAPDGAALTVHHGAGAGSPQVSPGEHELRWIAPEELDQLAWGQAERSFVPQLREVLLDGEVLGNSGRTRVGATVRSAAMQRDSYPARLVSYLQEEFVDVAPALLGADARGRDVFSVPRGDLQDPQTDDQVAVLARTLRRLNDVIGEAVDSDLRQWGHDDYTPSCVFFDELGTPTAVVGWECASSAATPVRQLALLAWTAVPLCNPLLVPEVAARRIAAIGRAYGGPTSREILDAVEARVRDGLSGDAYLGLNAEEALGRFIASRAAIDAELARIQRS